MHDFEITFMGTGTSHGIPVIGCQCRVCLSGDPRDKRLRTAALLRSPGAVVQVDTPPDFRAQCLREGVTRLDAVVYTHSHTDHILGFDDLRRFCEMEDKEMLIHASPRTMADLKRVFAYAFDGAHRYPNYIRPHPVEIQGPFSIGDLDFVPVDLPHGRMTTTGLVVWSGGRKLLAYFTDCQAVPAEAEEAARGAELLVLDALRHASHSTHLTLRGAIEASERISPRQTLFIHMCHELGHEETEATLPEGIRLAYDGLRVVL
ncbi:MAG: MBL fold metallo-hydrolase [Terrimicrobiaceae bacterium]|nr:MBL fold metallo-hydrolase [Terrimicrobiaceae bacterium]